MIIVSYNSITMSYAPPRLYASKNMPCINEKSGLQSRDLKIHYSDPNSNYIIEFMVKNCAKIIVLS